MNTKPNIQFPHDFVERVSKLVDGAVVMDDDRRKTVEKEKKTRSFDEMLARYLHEINSGEAGICKADLECIKRILPELYISVDLAICAIARCIEAEDITLILHCTRLLGRKRNSKKIDKQLLGKNLREIFEDSAEVFEIHRKGVDDKSMVRRKVKAALQVINECLTHNKTII